MAGAASGHSIPVWLMVTTTLPPASAGRMLTEVISTVASQVTVGEADAESEAASVSAGLLDWAVAESLSLLVVLPDALTAPAG
jgi:hypothetical protein